MEQELSDLPFENEIEERVAAAAYKCATICSIFVIIKRHLLAYHRFVKPDARLREKAKETAKTVFRRVSEWMPAQRKSQQAKSMVVGSKINKPARRSTGGSLTHNRRRSLSRWGNRRGSMSARDLMATNSHSRRDSWTNDQLQQLEV